MGSDSLMIIAWRQKDSGLREFLGLSMHAAHRCIDTSLLGELTGMLSRTADALAIVLYFTPPRESVRILF